MYTTLQISTTKQTMRDKPNCSPNYPVILSANDRLLPFEKKVGSTVVSWANIWLVDSLTGVDVVDLYPKINSADLKVETFASFKYVQYLGNIDFLTAYTIPNGIYYLKFVLNLTPSGTVTYYTDEFRVCSTIPEVPKCAYIYFRSSVDLPDAELLYSKNTFTQLVYLKGDLKAGEARYIEEISIKDGYEILEKKTIQYVHKLRTVVSDNLYKSVSLLPLHDVVTVHDYNGTSYSAQNVKITDVTWSGNGYCRLIIEFITEAVTFKTTNLDIQ